MGWLEPAYSPTNRRTNNRSELHERHDKRSPVAAPLRARWRDISASSPSVAQEGTRRDGLSRVHRLFSSLFPSVAVSPCASTSARAGPKLSFSKHARTSTRESRTLSRGSLSFPETRIRFAARLRRRLTDSTAARSPSVRSTSGSERIFSYTRGKKYTFKHNDCFALCRKKTESNVFVGDPREGHFLRVSRRRTRSRARCGFIAGKTGHRSTLLAHRRTSTSRQLSSTKKSRRNTIEFPSTRFRLWVLYNPLFLQHQFFFF